MEILQRVDPTSEATLGIGETDPTKCQVWRPNGARRTQSRPARADNVTILGIKFCRHDDAGALDHRQDIAHQSYFASQTLTTRSKAPQARLGALCSSIQTVFLWGMAAAGIAKAVCKDIQTTGRRQAEAALPVTRLTTGSWTATSAQERSSSRHAQTSGNSPDSTKQRCYT